MFKKALALALTLLLAFSAAGCDMVIYDKEKDGKLLLADVHGTQIYKKQLLEDYELYKSGYGIYASNENDKSMKETIAELKQTLLNSYVAKALADQKIAELGLTTLDEKQEEEIAAGLVEMEEYAMRAVETDLDTFAKENPGADLATKRVELEESARASYGLLDGSYERKLRENAYLENLKDQIAGQISVSEEEIKAWYDEQSVSQKSNLSEGKATISSLLTDSVLVYYPSVHKFIKHLVVQIPVDTRVEIKALRDEGKTEEADEWYRAELAKIKPKIDAAYAELKAGAGFDAVLEKYGEDEGMKAEPRKSEGYRVYNDSSDYNDEFVTYSLGLNNPGEYTEPYSSAMGYHISQLVNTISSGVRPLEEIKDEISALLAKQKREAAYEAKIEEWKQESGVIIYEKNL